LTRRHVIAALVCAAIEITPEIALAQKEVVSASDPPPRVAAQLHTDLGKMYAEPFRS